MRGRGWLSSLAESLLRPLLRSLAVRSTPAERRGLAVLLIVASLYVGVRASSPVFSAQFPQLFKSSELSSWPDLHACDLLNALEHLPSPASDARRPLRGQLAPQRKFRPSLVELAASTALPIQVAELDSAGWNALGLSPRQSASAVRYAEAVRGLGDSATLSRMRVLPEGWLAAFSPRLVFAQPIPAVAQPDTPTKPDINTVDSLALLEVYGIGPWVAGRILEARARWGGIANEQDLAEALRGWDSLATALAPRLVWEKTTIRRRCIDTLTASQCAALPGIRYRQADALLAYHRQHPGPLTNLYACLALDSTATTRVIQYLQVCGDSVSFERPLRPE